MQSLKWGLKHFPVNMAFIEPRILIYFYCKTNQIHQGLKFISFGITLYMFRTVFPPIISSSRLYIQQPNRYCCLLASGYPLTSRQQYLFGCCMYSLELLMIGGKTVRNTHSVTPNNINLRS